MRMDLLVAAVCLCVLASSAAAAEAADEARRDFERGSLLFHESDWPAAARAFEAAFARKPKAELLLNVGQAWRLASESGKAVDAYARYLALVPDAPDAAEIRQHILDLTIAQHGGATGRDTLAPRIEHDPPAVAEAGAPLVLHARLTDPSGVFQPEIRFRTRPGEYRSTPLVEEGELFVATLPPLRTGSVEYYLEAHDTMGNGPARHGTMSLPHRVEVPAPVLAASPRAATTPLPSKPPPDDELALVSTPARWSLGVELAPSFVWAPGAPAGVGLEGGALLRRDGLRFGVRAVAGAGAGLLVRAAIEPFEALPLAWGGLEAGFMGGSVAQASWGVASGIGMPVGPAVVGVEVALRHLPAAPDGVAPLSALALLTASFAFAGDTDAGAAGDAGSLR